MTAATPGRIHCIAQAREAAGSAGDSASDQSEDGFDVLSFPAVAARAHGPYVPVCQIPAMEGNAPSYISSYHVLEPAE